jgi:hypothetical protein
MPKSVLVSSKHCSIAQRKPLSQTSVLSLVLAEALLIKKLYFGSLCCI